MHRPKARPGEQPPPPSILDSTHVDIASEVIEALVKHILSDGLDTNEHQQRCVAMALFKTGGASINTSSEQSGYPIDKLNATLRDLLGKT